MTSHRARGREPAHTGASGWSRGSGKARVQPPTQTQRWAQGQAQNQTPGAQRMKRPADDSYTNENASGSGMPNNASGSQNGNGSGAGSFSFRSGFESGISKMWKATEN